MLLGPTTQPDKMVETMAEIGTVVGLVADEAVFAEDEEVVEVVVIKTITRNFCAQPALEQKLYFATIARFATTLSTGLTIALKRMTPPLSQKTTELGCEDGVGPSNERDRTTNKRQKTRRKR